MINAHKTQASLEKDTHKQTHALTPTHKRERERWDLWGRGAKSISSKM